MRAESLSDQLELDLEVAGERPRWRYSRLVLRSPHFRALGRRLEAVRRHFPELDGVCIRVGLARKRGVLGWGSLDPSQPGIWVRPRRPDCFTIAHELTHLLQARGEVPRGERACDLYALARSPQLVDVAPGYLRLPRALREAQPLEPEMRLLLFRAAREAVAARAAGRRDYLRLFERRVAAEVEPGHAPSRRRRAAP